jgi:hypothetical protein
MDTKRKQTEIPENKNKKWNMKVNEIINRNK